jgi:curved DNA-binding protein CbpA
VGNIVRVSALSEVKPDLDPDPTSEDLYAILGIDSTATPAQIKKAYRAAAMKYHPDQCRDPDAAEKFKRIKEAYEHLSDKFKREYYDKTGTRQPAQTEIDGMAEDLVHTVFMSVINEVAKAEEIPIHIDMYDPVVDVKENLRRGIENIRRMRTDWQREISRYESMLRRFKHKTGFSFEESPLALTMRDKVKQLHKLHTVALSDIAVHEKALDLAKDYACAPELNKDNMMNAMSFYFSNGGQHG